jgi:hypothetical protein
MKILTGKFPASFVTLWKKVAWGRMREDGLEKVKSLQQNLKYKIKHRGKWALRTTEFGDCA